MRAALVLGSSGFIGRHVVQRLADDGWWVDQLDKPAFDLTEPIEIPWPEWAWDVVFLLAAKVGVAAVEAAPHETLRTNVLIVQRVLDWLPNRGETLVFASSSEVYAEAVAMGLSPVPTPESTSLVADPVSTRGAYALSKIVGEGLVRHGHSRWVIVRYHNVYGPGQGRGWVIPDLFLGSEPVKSPQHTRAFCYVSDAVEGTLLAAKHPGQVFNVGTDVETPIGELALKIRQHAVFIPGPSNDPPRRCPDISKLRALGYVPKVGLDEGLALTLASL